jgi:transcriptional regulator with XRE-family HTH domain
MNARRKRVDKPPSLRIIPGMNATPLTQIRRGGKRRWTLAELAKRVGCSHSTLSTFEAGKDLLSPRLLAKYAAAVGRAQREVMDAFTIAAVAYHERKAAEAKAVLRDRLQGAPVRAERATATR